MPRFEAKLNSDKRWIANNFAPRTKDGSLKLYKRTTFNYRFYANKSKAPIIKKGDLLIFPQKINNELFCNCYLCEEDSEIDFFSWQDEIGQSSFNGCAIDIADMIPYLEKGLTKYNIDSFFKWLRNSS